MTAPSVTFTTGGTVQAGGGIYLKRSSDGELLEACQNGVFSYVLLPRQMGKSSLMTHAAQQLRSLGIHPVVIDLQAIGTQVTAENWYLGLLITMEEQVMLNTDILDWWGKHNYLGLTQRLTSFFEQVLLKEVTEQIVIFVDEIDTVLSFNFADDFFIAIRYLHQNRAQNPDLYRLSFVLLGVAAPGDLIRDQKRTPFNIGQPIDLRGFTLAEIQPLSTGLAQVLEVPETQALDLLEAVLHWTGGQPFLTQKLCQFMVTHESRPALGEEFPWVSELVHHKIIDRWEAQDTPPHLSTIRDRLVRSGEKTARLLGLYQQLLEQGDLPADDRPEQVELRLTGLVVKRNGRLQVFNRIYEAVFNPTWVAQALADLRPYGEAIQEWLSSGRLDESRLLRGQALQEARQWAEGKSLGDDDRRFLDASLEIERRDIERRLQAEAEANRILTAARDEAESKLRDAEQRKAEADSALEEAYQNLAAAKVRIKAFGAKEVYARGKILEALMLSLEAGAKYKTLDPTGDFKSQHLENTYVLVMASLQQSLYGTQNRKLYVFNDLEKQQSRIWNVITSVSFSPDGQTIVSGNSNGKLQFWNKDGINILTLDIEWGINSINFSSDGRMIVSGGDNKTLKLWCKDGTLLYTLEGHKDSVLSVSFSPGGGMIVSGSSDKTLKLWCKDGTLLYTLEGHKGWVNSVCFSPDGEIIVSGSNDKTLKLWYKDGYLIKTIESDSQILSVSFSPDGQTIASGSDAGMVKLFERNGTLIKTLEVQSRVLSVSFSPDGQTIAAGCAHGTINLWDRNGIPISILDTKQGCVRSVSFSPDGQTIISGGQPLHGSTGTVSLFQLNGILIKTISVKKRVLSVNFSPDGKILASAGNDEDFGSGQVNIWNRCGEFVTSFNTKSIVYSVGFSPNGETIITGSSDGTIKLWKRDGTPLLTWEGHQYEVLSVSFSPDGERIVSGGGDGQVVLWKRDGTYIQAIDVKSPVLCVSFSPNGQKIVSGSDDGLVRVWSTEGYLINTLDTHSSVLSVSFSPDGQTIISGSLNQTVKLWEWCDSNVKVLDAQGSIVSVSFSPDGQIIASGTDAGTVTLWERNGTHIYSLDTGLRLWSISFSPDGETIAIGSLNGIIKLWDWNLDRFLAMGCYWTADYRKNQPNSETNQLINATCERPEVKAQLPDLLRVQAMETAKTGNYAAALKFLQDAQALNPQINLTSQQLQTLASDAVQQQALSRVEFSSLDQLSELFSQPEAIPDNFQHVAPLTESHRRQALWLLDRAKSINPNFDLAAATQKIQKTWQESKKQIALTFVNEGDKKVREQQSGEALQQYRYALQLDPTLPFTPESRIQEQNPESPP